MKRREFHVSVFKYSAAALFTPYLRGLAQASAPADPATLYKNAIVIDSLSGPFVDLDVSPGPKVLAEIRQSGITAVNYTISERDFEGTIKNLGLIQALVEKYPETFTIVRNHSDISRAKRDNRLGIIPGFQDTTFLEEDPWADRNVPKSWRAYMQITYNNRGAFGDGCLEPGNAGLSKPGTAAVKKMNDIGVAVDVESQRISHHGRSDLRFIEASADLPCGMRRRLSPIPATSPTNSQVPGRPRRLFRRISHALSGCLSPAVPTRQHVLAHLLHAINVCGADHVGIGSDGSIEKVVLTPAQKAEFDADIARRKKLGIGAPGEDRYPYVPDLNGPDHMEIIAVELARRGQPSSVVEKVLGSNFQRVLGEIW